MILERKGFQVIEVNTPGKLDIDILVNNKDFVIDKFWNTFIETTDEDCKQKWQSLITESGWSSHMMVVCIKVRSYNEKNFSKIIVRNQFN